MKLSERIRKQQLYDDGQVHNDLWEINEEQLEELEKLQTQFEAELNAAKNDHERLKQLEAEKERLQSTIDFAHIVASRVEAERDTAELAYANECATNVCIKAENERLRRELALLKKGWRTGSVDEFLADITTLENEVIRLEDELDKLEEELLTYRMTI